MSYLTDLLDEERKKKKPSQKATEENKNKALETKVNNNKSSLVSMLEESKKNKDFFKTSEVKVETTKTEEPKKENIFQKAKNTITNLFKKKEDTATQTQNQSEIPKDILGNPIQNIGVGSVKTELGQKIDNFKEEKKKELNEPIEQKVYKVQLKLDEANLEIQALSDGILNGGIKEGELDNAYKKIDELKNDVKAYSAYLDHPTNDIDFFIEVEKSRKTSDPNYKEPGIGGQFVESIKQTSADALSSFGASMEMIGNMTDSILLSEAGRDLNKKYQKVIAENPDWNAPEDQKWGPEKISRLAGGFIPTLLGSVATGLVVSIATGGNIAAGGVAGFAYGFALEGGSTYKEAKSYGVSESDAQKWGSIVGTVNGLLEVIFPTKILSGKYLIKQSTKKELSGTLAKTIINEAKKEGLKIAENGLIEGSEELTQQLVSNSVAKNYDQNRSLWDGVLESFVGGAISGGVIGAFEKNTNQNLSTPQTDPKSIGKVFEKNKVFDQEISTINNPEDQNKNLSGLSTSSEGVEQTKKEEEVNNPIKVINDNTKEDGTIDLPAKTVLYKGTDTSGKLEITKYDDQGAGYYLTVDKETAKNYGKTIDEYSGLNNLKLINRDTEAGKAIYNEVRSQYTEDPTKEQITQIAEKVSSELKEKGYDGWFWSKPGDPGSEIVVFDKEKLSKLNSQVETKTNINKMSSAEIRDLLKTTEKKIDNLDGISRKEAITTSNKLREKLNKYYQENSKVIYQNSNVEIKTVRYSDGRYGVSYNINLKNSGEAVPIYGDFNSRRSAITSAKKAINIFLNKNIKDSGLSEKKIIRQVVKDLENKVKSKPKKIKKKLTKAEIQSKADKKARIEVAKMTRSMFEESDLKNISKLRIIARSREVQEGDIETLRKKAGNLVEKVIESVRVLPQYSDLNDEDALAIAMEIPTKRQAMTGDYSIESNYIKEKQNTKIEPAKTPEQLQEKINQLNKMAQANAILRRTGGITNKKAVGQFVQNKDGKKIVAPEGEVRLKGKYIADDSKYISVLAHELGHAIDYTVTGTTNEKTFEVFGKDLTASQIKTLENELIEVTKEIEGEVAYGKNKEYFNKPSELLARFFQKLIVAPANIEEIAPTAYEMIQEQQVVHPIINDFFEVVKGNLFKKPGFKFLPDLRQTYQKVLGSDRVGNVAYNNEIAHRAMQERAKIVIGKFIDKKFKGIKDDPALLFKVAESIKNTTNNIPEFGTRDFQIAKTEKEARALKEAGYEFVDTQIVDGIEYAKYAKQRYTADQGLEMFNQLSEEGKKLILDFTAEKKQAKDYFNRNIIKDVNNINGEIEGWVHHYFEEEPTGVGGKNKLKFKKAGATQQRKGAEGYVEDFKKAMTKALVDLESTKVFNDFIQRQFSMISKPIQEGKAPDKGWTEVMGNLKSGLGTAQEKRKVIIKDGKAFVPKQTRYQIPTQIYKRYQLWTGLVEEASTATRIINSLNRYWQVNVLFHIGSASTNFLSGGLQYGSKILTDFYTETLTGKIKYTQTRRDLSAMLKVLLPKGWMKAPDYIYGADLSNWYGNFTKQKGIFDKGIDAYADKALKLYGTIERYWKKTIMVAENVEDLKKLNKITKKGLVLPNAEEREMMAQINNEVDLFAYDYDNIPTWLQAHSRSTFGAMLKPFAKYPYKYAKMILNMAGSVFDRSQPWQTRTAKLLALATMTALYGAYAEERKKKQQTTEGDEETPARLSPRGKLFVGKDDKGNELFLRTAKYPFLNLTNTAISLSNGEISGAMDTVSDMLGSIGPIAKIGLLTVFGYRNKYELYDSEPVIIGNSLATYIPGYRFLNDASNFFDPFKRKQSTFGQTFTKLIPTTDSNLQDKLHGEIRTERIPIEGNVKRQPGQKLTRTTVDFALKQYKWDILLSALTGMYLTRINPDYAEAVKIRNAENKKKAEKEAASEKKKIYY